MNEIWLYKVWPKIFLTWNVLCSCGKLATCKEWLWLTPVAQTCTNIDAKSNKKMEWKKKLQVNPSSPSFSKPRRAPLTFFPLQRSLQMACREWAKALTASLRKCSHPTGRVGACCLSWPLGGGVMSTKICYFFCDYLSMNQNKTLATYLESDALNFQDVITFV